MNTLFENKKILIVDDEEKARLYLATIVEELHPEVTIKLAATPNEALFFLKRNNIDIVLLDVEMPGMTGLEMIQSLSDKTKHTPVIFVSAYKRAEFIQSAMRLNAVDYIDKPVNPTELENALLKAIQTNPKLPNLTEFQKLSNKFCLLTDSGEMFVEQNEIFYFTSLKRYSTATLIDGTCKTVRDNLEVLSHKLPSTHFLRVSRQYIINLKYIKFASKSNKTITLVAGGEQKTLNKIFPSLISELITKYSLKNQSNT